MVEFVTAVSLLLALLNPFLVIVYLMDVIRKVDASTFRHVLIRAAFISTAVLCCFALSGDVIFRYVVQAEFASFQIFGGIVFLLIGLQFVFRGPSAIELLRGEAKHLAGAIAMPVLIGPGTVSVSVLIGQRISPLMACLAIALAMVISISTIMILKSIHDHVVSTSEALVERYFEIAGRVTALYVGTISVEMIMKGLQFWLKVF